MSQKQKMANSPLNHNTLASVKTWGIQQELVICRCKGKKLFRSLQMVSEKRLSNCWFKVLQNH
ncbi:hypothetical protein H1R81_20040 [Emticicia sp. BO119]|nr:hypothetical protein [Emticicia sp. BO119]